MRKIQSPFTTPKLRVKYALDRLEKDPDFAVVLAWLLKECHVTHPVFSTDPSTVVWNESKRHLAMSLLALMGKDTPDYIVEQLNNNNTE